MTVFFSIVIFLIILLVLIFVHELGHFIAAKKTGMRVDEFAIGFPPTLWSRQVGETRYALNALPIGGYVKIFGEDGNEEVSMEEKARAFGARPKWAQAVVLIAGVAMNILLAWVLLALIAMIGASTQIDERDVTPTATLQVAGIIPESPAAVLPPRAEIIAVTSGDQVLETLLPSTFIAFVQANNEAEFTITYLAGTEEKQVTLTPVKGLVTEDPERLVLGVQLALVDTVRYGFVAAVVRATEQTISILGAIIVGVATLLSGIVVGGADLSQVAGPVGIVSYVGEAATFGITSLLFFTAVISLNLAVINLLPIPALDGGRLIFVGLEALVRRPINPVWMMRVNTFGLLFLLALMVLVTISDISKFF